jgi:hypothetical protein
MKAEVIGNFHPEYERGISMKETGMFVKIIETKPVASLRRAWSCDTDRAEFADRTVHPIKSGTKSFMIFFSIQFFYGRLLIANE